MGMAHKLIGDHLQQIFLDFQYVPSRCEIDPVGNAKYVGIHPHGVLAECGVEDYVGRLAADPRQCFQFGPCGRDLGVVPIDEQSTGLDDIACLAVVESDGTDKGLQFLFTEGEYPRWGVGYSKQFSAGLVNADIGRLGGQNHTDE